MLLRTLLSRYAIEATRSPGQLSFQRAVRLPWATSVRFLPIALSSRNYATPAKPKKGSIGETSAKARTRKPASVSASANKEEAAKLKAQARKDKAEAKVAQKEKAAAKKKRAQEKVAAAKRKLAAAKTKKQRDRERAKTKKAKVAKPVSPEKQARKKAKQVREEKKQLMSTALSPPTAARTAWTLFLQERTSQLKGKAGDQATSREKLSSTTKDAAAAYKSLSPADLEHYNHLANESKAEQSAKYNDFIKAHTPDQIRAANVARGKLRRQATKPSRKWPPLKDDRLLSKPLTPFLAFLSARHATGDLKHIALADASRLISDEWKALGNAEKQSYADKFKQDTEQYVADHARVYGFPPRAASGQTTADATA